MIVQCPTAASGSSATAEGGKRVRELGRRLCAGLEDGRRDVGTNEGMRAASEKGQKRILSQSLQKGTQHYLRLALGLVSPPRTPDFQNWEGAARDLLEQPQETNRR